MRASVAKPELVKLEGAQESIQIRALEGGGGAAKRDRTIREREDRVWEKKRKNK
jgi:hypothetical protein